MEGHHTILVSAICSQFQIKLKVNKDELGVEERHEVDENLTNNMLLITIKRVIKAIKLSVWPCFRIPVGGSAISLINNSFLFASKGHHEEWFEAEFLVGLSLISARKFI